MGLTIRYSYKAKRLSAKRLANIMSELHEYAETLYEHGVLKNVTRLMHIEKQDYLDYASFGEDGLTKRMGPDKIQVLKDSRASIGKFIKVQDVHGKTKQITDYHSVLPTEGWSFIVWPGYGCESATFGLFKYPKYFNTPNKYGLYGKESPIRLTTNLPGWQWNSFCKTQFAASHGPAHFLTCHMAICLMIEKLKSIPEIEVECSDEGEFMETHDLRNLLKQASQGYWEDMTDRLSGEMMYQLSQIDQPSKISSLHDATLIMSRISNSITRQKFYSKVYSYQDFRKWHDSFIELIMEQVESGNPEAVKLRQYTGKMIDSGIKFDQDDFMSGLSILVPNFQKSVNLN